MTTPISEIADGKVLEMNENNGASADADRAFVASDGAASASPPSASIPCAESGLIDMLLSDNRRMRKAGCQLAEAAIHVVREYDGVHRLAMAVGGWAHAIANEGDRKARAVAGWVESVVGKPAKEKLYDELLYAVASKHEGETRHETALRYIRERERDSDGSGEAGQTAKRAGPKATARAEGIAQPPLGDSNP